MHTETIKTVDSWAVMIIEKYGRNSEEHKLCVLIFDWIDCKEITYKQALADLESCYKRGEICEDSIDEPE